MRSLLDLVLPLECVGCGQRGVVTCADGMRELAVRPRVMWPRPSPPRLPTPWTVAPYDGHVRQFLLAYKEEGMAVLRRPLATALATSLLAAMASFEGEVPVVVVPVPSSRASCRRRGCDVVADLATAAASRLRAGGRSLHVVRALRHSRKVADSAGLTAEERAANLAGAFSVRASCAPRLAGSRVVLVDDLITTGVTLRECADSLRAAGADVIAAATVAATRRRGHSP